MNGLTPADDTIAPTEDRASEGLSHLALLRVGGPDARTFLDAQLTRNVPPGDGKASPAGYCSVKGRLLASFVIWSDAESIGLLLSRDIADALVKRLRMYVLRAKVTIDDVDVRRI